MDYLEDPTFINDSLQMRLCRSPCVTDLMGKQIIPIAPYWLLVRAQPLHMTPSKRLIDKPHADCKYRKKLYDNG